MKFQMKSTYCCENAAIKIIYKKIIIIIKKKKQKKGGKDDALIGMNQYRD